MTNAQTPAPTSQPNPWSIALVGVGLLALVIALVLLLVPAEDSGTRGLVGLVFGILGAALLAAWGLLGGLVWQLRRSR